MSKVKSILDVTIVHLICQWEYSIYDYIDKCMPKKHKYTLVSQMLNCIGEARSAVVESMSLPMEFIDEKYHCLCLAQVWLHNAEILLNHLNDMQDISNEAKARFDMNLADIYGNLDRLSSSFCRKMKDRQSANPTGMAEETEN